MYNSPALAIPLRSFFGQWEKSDIIDQRLLDYANWMAMQEAKTFIDTKAFLKAVNAGLTFYSNIKVRVWVRREH